MEPVERVEFFFDPICPYAFQTSLWIREVRRITGLEITWRFFSLEEINRPEGKKHPWERPVAYGWTPMRVGAWLRRLDPGLLDAWYDACGRALHFEGRRPYEPEVAADLLAAIGAPAAAWADALADPTTHDEVRADHEFAVAEYAGFGVPILKFPVGRAVFGPVVVPYPSGRRRPPALGTHRRLRPVPRALRDQDTEDRRRRRPHRPHLHAVSREPRVADHPEPRPLTLAGQAGCLPPRTNSTTSDPL